MSVADLITEAREDYLLDTVADYLWSDAQLTRYANEAILEACTRAPLLVRSRTLTVTATNASYALNQYTRQILLMRLSLETLPLTQMTAEELALRYGPAWRGHNGTPIHYVRLNKTLTLYPIPIVNDTLSMTTTNIPDDTFYLDDDIDAAYHHDLVYYMLYKAYMKRDADTYNPIKANEYLALFDAKFGIKRSAKYDAVAFNSPMYGTITAGRMC